VTLTARTIILLATLTMLIAALIAARYGLHPHPLASIIGDPHHCNGASPGPGCSS
jgi:hypothetical protein